METKDILISFDTTVSMYPCLTQVRKNITKLVQRLFSEDKTLRIGIIAHGDYHLEPQFGSPYITKMLDFSSDVNKITKFINEVEPTNGVDWDECYEFVLNQARFASWGAGNKKSIIMVGDATPHSAYYIKNTKNLDWKNEASLLGEAGIKIYSVQAMNHTSSDFFWKGISSLTNGFHIKLDQFSDIYHLIMGVGLQQISDDALVDYEKELIVNGQFNRNIDNMFGTMLGRKTTTFTSTASSLGAVSPGRFQVMDIDTDVAIKKFVEDNGITFKVGRGFYQFTKRSTIQDYKEIILQHKLTGDMFNGDKAREIAGIPVGETARVSPENLSDYNVFVQSTSHNRVLKAGTKFLYEVPEEM